MRKHSALDLAKRQLLGGQPWGDVVIGVCSHFICRDCGVEYRVSDGLEACAFCNDCKDAALDAMAEALVTLTPRAPRGQRRNPK